MLLHDSRRAARQGLSGELVTLPKQDRTQWDMARIAEGLAVLDRAARLGRADGPYLIQAQIAAVHAQATTAGDTDWARIVALYDRLQAVNPDPVVALNRAVAVAEAFGPSPALALVDGLATDGALDGYYLFHSTRAELLRRLGRSPEAAEAFARARDLATNDVERAYLERRRFEAADS